MAVTPATPDPAARAQVVRSVVTHFAIENKNRAGKKTWPLERPTKGQLMLSLESDRANVKPGSPGDNV